MNSPPLATPILEPIPEYTALTMAIRMARFEDPAVQQAQQELESRARGVRPSDVAAWQGVYQCALALIDIVLKAQQSNEAKAATQAQQAELARLAATAGPAVVQELQRETNEWSNRLASQLAQLEQKSTRSIAALEISSSVDDTQGKTVFSVRDDQLTGLREWFGNAVQAWWKNNEALVAQRAKEAIEPALAGAKALTFDVESLTSYQPPAATIDPKGHSAVTPGRFEALGATYKFVMSGVMGASALGFIVSRMQISGIGEVLKWVSIAVFVAALVLAIITVPKKQRQVAARLHASAADQVRQELNQVLARELKLQKDAQLQAIRKHLSAEIRRATAKFRELSGPSGPSLPKMPSGLMPQDVQRLQGEWRPALERRHKELGALAK